MTADRILHLATCRCGAEFIRELTHAGGRGAPPRRYCSLDCRDQARLDRRARTRAASRPLLHAQRLHARRYAGLTALHELEDAGQLSIDPTPLPAVPPVGSVLP